MIKNVMSGNISRIVVGLSGVSCGGKTTVTKLLHAAFPWASVVHQDVYFRPADSKHHVYLPNLKCNDWELKSALDFTRMENDVKKIIVGNSLHKMTKAAFFPNDDFVNKHKLQPDQIMPFSKYSHVQLVILEGHIIFHHQPFYKLCNLRYFFTLDEEECRNRRRIRVYDPPNPPGFFEECVWPAYERRLSHVKNLSGINYIDAKSIPLLTIYEMILLDIVAHMEKLSVENLRKRESK